MDRYQVLVAFVEENMVVKPSPSDVRRRQVPKYLGTCVLGLDLDHPAPACSLTTGKRTKTGYIVFQIDSGLSGYLQSANTIDFPVSGSFFLLGSLATIVEGWLLCNRALATYTGQSPGQGLLATSYLYVLCKSND